MAFTTIDRTSLLRIEISHVVTGVDDTDERKEECWLRIDTDGNKSHFANIKPEHIEECVDHITRSLMEFKPGEGK